MTTTSTVDHDLLVDAAWLAAHLSDPLLRVVEVDVSITAYEDWHIEGADVWNIYTDLKTPTSDLSGRPRSRPCSHAPASPPTPPWSSTGTARHSGCG